MSLNINSFILLQNTAMWDNSGVMVVQNVYRCYGDVMVKMTVRMNLMKKIAVSDCGFLFDKLKIQLQSVLTVKQMRLFGFSCSG